MEWTNSTISDRSLASTSLASTFVAFLSIAQQAGLDFLPIGWHEGLGFLGKGATTEVSQSTINIKHSFAFKRKSSGTNVTDTALLNALCTEILVLSHPPIKEDPHIVDLLGISWETLTSGEAWPILVLPTADFNSLDEFFSYPEGYGTSFSDKLIFCSHIISAVKKLHACDVVHGDLKPQNVLVYKDSGLAYTAKVADVGFSCLSGSGIDQVYPPKSAPWFAPEWHHRGFSMKTAKVMDIFSLGMLCLWIVMEHAFQNSTDTEFKILADGITWPTDMKPKLTTNLLSRWKEQRALVEQAAHFVARLEDATAQEKSELLLFFSRTLQHNPAEREVEFVKIVENLSIFKISEVGNISKCERLNTPSHRDFQLAAAIPQLSITSYQVRSSILSALESVWKVSASETVSHCCKSCSQSIAFQLAISSHIGFGGCLDDLKTKEWLQRSSRNAQDLEKEIRGLRDYFFNLTYTGEFERLKCDGFIHILDFAEQYSQPDIYHRFEDALKTEIIGSSQILGNSHIVTIQLKLALASIHKGRLQFAEAAHLEKEVLDSLLDEVEVDNPLVLKAMLRLGSTYCQMRNYKEALELQTDAVQRTRAFFGDEHPTTLNARANVASTIWAQGKWEEAELLFLRLVKGNEDVGGINHPETLGLRANVAMAQKQMGKLKEAEAMEIDTASRCLQTFGPNSIVTWRVTSNLAQTYVQQGQFDKAEELLHSLRIDLDKPLVDMHADKLRLFNDLGLVYYGQRRFQKAQDVLKRTARAQDEVLGRNHSDAIATSLNLASIYYDEGDHDMAICLTLELLERCSENRTEARVINKSLDIHVMMKLATMLNQQHLWSKAEDLEVEIVSRCRETMGPNHPKTMEAKAVLCETYGYEQKYDQADELELSLSLEMLENLRKNDAVILKPLVNLGSEYVEKSEFSRAQRVLQKVWSAAKLVLGPEHVLTGTALANLASAYALQGMGQQAYDAYLDLLDIRYKSLGPEHPSTQTTLANFVYFCDCIGHNPNLELENLKR